MAGLVVRGPTVRTGLSTSPDMVSRPVQKSCVHKCTVTKDTLIVNNMYFIAFIGEVINNLDSASSEREHLSCFTVLKLNVMIISSLHVY
jgi:hypothetical protein